MKYSKIMLLNPKKSHARVASDLPLGLCYISAMLKKCGYENIVGLDLLKDTESKFENEVKNADILGIHTTSKLFSDVVGIAKRAKELNPNIVVIIGGPHATLEPKEVISTDAVDFVVCGEGEYTFLEIVKAIENNGDFSKVKGIWYKENGNIKQTPKREWIKNLDELPFPDRNLFDINKYKPYKFFPPFVPLMAGRSCPYNCTNCQPALKEIAGPYRIRSVENVITEIKQIIKKYRIKTFWFNDNDLTVNRQWVKDFCEAVVKENLKIKWGCSGRANVLDKPLMKLMKDAGCITIHFGFEHGCQEVLDKLINKMITVKRAKEVINEANEIGLRTHCWFMIGIPGSTIDQEMESLDVAKHLNCNSIMVQVFQPQPHIKMNEICKEKGWLLPYSLDNLDEQKSFFKTLYWGPEFIEELKLKFIHDFEKAGWATDESLIFRNIKQEIKQNFTLYVGREFLTFLADGNKNHLKWILRAFRFKFFGVPTL